MTRLLPIAAVAILLPSCAPAPPRPLAWAASNDPPLPTAMLSVHNRERRAFGSPPLAWDPAIAAPARAYAGQLARVGRLEHSPRQLRPGQGENLWIGTRGAFPLEAMAGGWADERRHFRPGRFPAVSRTGRWSDVGHFTQMVWPSTSRLGCGLASSARWDVLVCRYAPAGNVDGVVLAPR